DIAPFSDDRQPRTKRIMETIDTPAADKGLDKKKAIVDGQAKLLTPEKQTPLDQKMKAVFEADNRMRHVLTENLKPRTESARSMTDRARMAFRRFDPSRIPVEDRAKTTYLAPDDNLLNAMKVNFKDKVHELTDIKGGKLRVHLTDKLKDLLLHQD